MTAFRGNGEKIPFLNQCRGSGSIHIGVILPDPDPFILFSRKLQYIIQNTENHYSYELIFIFMWWDSRIEEIINNLPQSLVSIRQ